MKKIDFNKNWTCKCLTRDEEPYSVTLPHDAMRSEPRTEESTVAKRFSSSLKVFIIMRKFILMERKLHTDRTDTRIFM